MNHVTDSGVIAVSANRDLLQFLGELVETEGRALLSAESAEKAGHLVRSRKPAAAIVDHNLPDGSGVRLATEFLHTVPNMFVIILASSVLPSEEEALCTEQYFTVLQKPFLAAELTNRLKEPSKPAST
jgi:DNA-binding response OmpR family regulator